MICIWLGPNLNSMGSADNLAPLKRSQRQNNTKKPLWFSDTLKESKKTCRAFEKAWRKDRTADNMAALKNATRKHHHLIRTAKRNFFTDRLDKNSHNSRELFSIVKEFSNPSANANAVTPSQDLCESLATFFHRKISDLHDSFGHQTQPNTTEPTSPTITLNNWTHISTEETKSIMNSIHSGAPSDPCPHFIFNKADNIIAPHLQTVINSSFSSATFPEFWKHAEVNALLKKPTADPSDLKNIRPISLLPFPAKVIEKTVNKQLTTFLEDNNLLDPSQTGFRTNHSTETALISVTDDIRTLMDNGETVALILLDLSAAFDTVCHRTLITRLRSTGIQDQALDWIASFLVNRSRRVYLPPFRSEPTEIICGVPQGSSLSPTLFNVYMSPLANIVRKHDIIITSYADDTQLILSLTKDPASAKTNLQEGMKDVADWMRLSRLKLNSEKTEVLILGNTPSAWDDSWWPTAFGTAPTPADHARNLGFILDPLLTMTKQVNAVSSACFLTLRMLHKIFRWIPTDTRKTVTHALVTSRLDYGNTLYAGTTAKLQNRLQRIQNASARLILDVPRNSHISAHLRHLHWLPVSKRITFRLLTHAHKALHDKGPEYLNRRLNFYVPTRPLRSSGLALAAVPRIRRSTAGGRSFSFLAAKTWNSLPTSLRTTQDHSAFRRLLKTWLFEQR
ncbi:hypothetical protein NDU88_007894 [Pleurodeles waltl]|uniref:Reverse transcriptase domain-containing protein n=1 Tax=Pleurodeles waltl TaxID=8319 RepID=A0AAV7N3B6_PLEWA|nr:hypothetical protein NDU88_007894 [Pleurodeles waltl]